MNRLSQASLSCFLVTLVLSLFTLLGCSSPTNIETGVLTQQNLLPLMVGNSWTYQIHNFGTGQSGCTSSTDTITVQSSSVIQNNTVFYLNTLCGAAGDLLALSPSPNTEEVLEYSDPDWSAWLDLPVQDGHTWTSAGKTYTWGSILGLVSVPSGNYNDCWTRNEATSGLTYSVFCRQVGMVIYQTDDGNGNGWSARLQSVTL